MSTEFLTSNLDRINYLCSLLKARATGKESSDQEFKELRTELLSNNELATYLPNWLRLTRDLDAFWDFIQPKYDTYRERRIFLDEAFSESINYLEVGSPNPQSSIMPTVNEIKNAGQINTMPTQPHSNPTLVSSYQKKNKVFIVHGHDDAAKQEVARYVENLGLEAIILHEKASTGMTIIEKIEHYSGQADFALVLYTPCDKGRGATETNVHPRDRARQNVVFEHGYLMAKLGRKNVCALVKGQIETPNDISGVVYVPMDAPGAWKNSVNTELKACGYNI